MVRAVNAGPASRAACGVNVDLTDSALTAPVEAGAGTTNSGGTVSTLADTRHSAGIATGSVFDLISHALTRVAALAGGAGDTGRSRATTLLRAGSSNAGLAETAPSTGLGTRTR